MVKGRQAMTVNDLARRAGVAAHVVRYYAQRGLLSPVRNTRNAYREFGEADLVRLRFVCRARAVGFTLREIGVILKAADGVGVEGMQVSDLVRSRSARNEKKLADAQRLQQRINDVVTFWSKAPDESLNTEALKRLIEAMAFEE